MLNSKIYWGNYTQLGAYLYSLHYTPTPVYSEPSYAGLVVLIIFLVIFTLLLIAVGVFYFFFGGKKHLNKIEVGKFVKEKIVKGRFVKEKPVVVSDVNNVN